MEKKDEENETSCWSDIDDEVKNILKLKSQAELEGGAGNRTELLSAIRETSKNREADMGPVRFDNAYEVEKSELKWPNDFFEETISKALNVADAPNTKNLEEIEEELVKYIEDKSWRGALAIIAVIKKGQLRQKIDDVARLKRALDEVLKHLESEKKDASDASPQQPAAEIIKRIFLLDKIAHNDYLFRLLNADAWKRAQVFLEIKHPPIQRVINDQVCWTPELTENNSLGLVLSSDKKNESKNESRIPLLKLLLRKRSGTAEVLDNAAIVKWANDTSQKKLYSFYIYDLVTQLTLVAGFFYLAEHKMAFYSVVGIGLFMSLPRCALHVAGPLTGPLRKSYEIFSFGILVLATADQILANTLSKISDNPIKNYEYFFLVINLIATAMIGFAAMNALGNFIHPLKKAYVVFSRTVSDAIYISAPIGICFTIIFVHAMKNASIPEVSGCYESNGDSYQIADYNLDKKCSNWESYQYLFLTVLGGGSVEFDLADVDKIKPIFERTGKRILGATYSFLFETVLFKGFVIGKIVADFNENWKKSERELIAHRVRTIVMLVDSALCPSSGQVIDTIKAFRMADLMVTLKETFLNL